MVVDYVDELSESRAGKVLGRSMFYVKATTIPRFLVSLEQGFSTGDTLGVRSTKAGGTR